MLVVKDAMVLIHLSKMLLIEKSCKYFGAVIIPLLIEKEVTTGAYPDVHFVVDLIKRGVLTVKDVKNKNLIRKANEFNIQGGEAEAVALYWQEQADLLATDDDNVRKKKDILGLQIIGTPAILLQLFKEKVINKTETYDALNILKKTGWFSSIVFDKIRMEVDKNG
ncbi:hypothetical protein J4207_03995 [Candidatus Woesearchaeota archaeon]|nr:hypothetical protein [Candidatus Woesearchaeota archaeon]